MNDEKANLLSALMAEHRALHAYLLAEWDEYRAVEGAKVGLPYGDPQKARIASFKAHNDLISAHDEVTNYWPEETP